MEKILPLTLSFSMVLGLTQVSAATWHVNASASEFGDGTSWEKPLETIQEGIDKASDSDTVIVARGTYAENINFKGKNIVVRSTYLENLTAVHETIIDGGKRGSVVTFAGTESESCVLSGFTIQNGSAGGGGGVYGGSPPDLTRATIQNNVITGNNSSGYGAAIAYCFGIIRNNTISGNSGRSGVALYWCTGTILNSIIWANEGKIQIIESSIPTHSCIQHWEGRGEGNIPHYPYFVNAASSDYHLRSWSPCIDGGDPTSPFSEEPEPNGGRINMGAYGNTAAATSKCPDTDSDGLPDDWEMQCFGNLAEGADDDPDQDLMSNIHELNRGFDPQIPGAFFVCSSVKDSGDGTSWETAFKTVQEAINVSAKGDTTTVAQGIYVENIKFYGRSIKLRSINPLDSTVVADTILDGGRAGSVVTFSGTEDETCLLSGFTIRNGNAEDGGGIYGGSQDNQSRARIQNNIIRNNSATDCGGGLFRFKGKIDNNTIFQNSATVHGGGIYDCDGMIESNTITSNTARAGAGLASCGGFVGNNTVTGNTAVTSGGGVWSSFGTVQNNIITDNSAECGGGLAYCYGTIRNNTITRNSATAHGGGLAHCAAAILNCIIWENTAPVGSQLHDSLGPTHCCIQGWGIKGDGNIAKSPLFVESDYRLSADSPCIDAGENEGWMWEATDFEGNPRILPGISEWKVDMGSYEYVSPAYQLRDYVRKSAKGIQLIWTSQVGQTYTIWSREGLSAGDWLEVATLMSECVVTIWTDLDTSLSQRFYRIEARQ